MCKPSGTASLIFVRKFVCGLPSPSATTKRFSFMQNRLFGIVRPAYEYMSIKLPTLDEYYRLAAMVFDEMKITKIAQIDRKIDMVLGPGTQVSY